MPLFIPTFNLKADVPKPSPAQELRDYVSVMKTHANRASDPSGDGVWRTINGRRVFIKQGESLDEALIRSGIEKHIRTAEGKIKRRVPVSERPLNDPEERRLASMRRNTKLEGKTSKQVPPNDRELEDLQTWADHPGRGSS